MKEFINDNTPDVSKGEEPDDCKKDLGKTRSYRKMSLGLMAVVRGGGHIDAFQPIYG